MNNFDMNTRRDVTGADTGMKLFFQKVYGYMAIALAVTAAAGFVVQNFFLTEVANLLARSFVGFAVMFAIEMGLILMIHKSSIQNPAKAFGLLMTFAVAQGLILGLYLAIYTTASVAVAFMSTAGLYAGMAAYGFFTKKSLASLQPILFGAVIGLIIAAIANIFIASSSFSLLISAITVLVFAIFTAYDNNRLRELYTQMAGQGYENGSNELTGIAIMGALSLYLDFLNIFYSLLQIFGDTRD
ncbi:Bax inhibitor-1/YccA family protein [Leuconostocaceae bacterium ESL0958]|nr:Bax inhibitor-1/YccA family protein [Leuconostocaceae bacterium ESL0958]